MISVAICDDMADQLTVTSNLTEEYIKTHNVDMKVSWFSHPDQLLTTLQTERFHVYILDIVMPMVNGIQLGREIRKSDIEAQIIYVTTEPQFALESFSSNPLNYLIKPISKELFFDTMSLALSKVTENIQKVLRIKTSNGIRALNHADIVCCEYIKHTVRYTTTKADYIITVTMREPFADIVAPLFEDYRFIQPHTSYVINMSRVERMTKDAFYMQGGAVVPIAQKRYTQTSDSYLDYLLNKGGSKK